MLCARSPNAATLLNVVSAAHGAHPMRVRNCPCIASSDNLLDFARFAVGGLPKSLH